MTARRGYGYEACEGKKETPQCTASTPALLGTGRGLGTTVACMRKVDNVFLFIMEDLERPRVADTTLARASFLSRIDVD